jgi:outer membrane protein assembly factor BamB
MRRLHWLARLGRQHRAVVVVALSALAVAVEAEAPLRWQNLGPSTLLDGAATSITVNGDVVVASGNLCSTPSVLSCRWFVRAVDANTGVTRWEDRETVGSGSTRVLLHQNRAFVSGVIGGAFVVRAYEVHTGANLWEQRIDDPFGIAEVAEMVGAHGNRVFAVGTIVRQVSSWNDFAVFAFDASTGDQIWQSITSSSTPGRFDVANALDSQGARLFTAGSLDNFSTILVRAFDTRTGRVLWEDHIAGGSQFLAFRQVATLGDLVFVAGGVQTGADQDLVVRGYDQRSGAIRWTHVEDAGGNDEVPELHVSGNRLFAAGFDACDPSFFACSFVVRQLDPRSGAVIWRDAFQDVAGGDALSTTLTSNGGRLYAGGLVQDADGAYQWALRAYDAASGATVQDERIANSFLNRLASAGNSVYAAGSIGRLDVGSDFVIRAYQFNGQ